MAPAAKAYRSMVDAFEEAREQQMSEYTSQGSKWLAAVRSWIQWNCTNGGIVTWGSDEKLFPHITARQIEEVAAKAVDAAFPEVDKIKKENQELKMRLFVLTGSSKV